MFEGYRIIDTHVHTFANDEIATKIMKTFNKMYNIEFQNPGTGSLTNVIDNMDKGGIDITLIANFYTPKIMRDSNEFWIRVAQQSGNRLVPLVNFHPEFDGSMPEYLHKYISEGAKGIKLHPMGQSFSMLDSKMQDLYRECNALKFPILVHCGRVSNARLNEYSDIEHIIPIIEKYPDMPVILAHMADGNKNDVLEISSNFENAYFDTSIVITGYNEIARVNEPSWLEDEYVVEVIEQIGAHKVLFGSDYPWGSPIPDIHRIIKMNLSKSQKSMIFSENAVRIYKL